MRYGRFAVYCIAEVVSESPLRFDYFKIGITTNLKGRIKALQTGNPHPLAAIVVDWFRDIGDARSVERRAHEYLSEHSVSGEWFKSYEIGGGCPFEALSIAASFTPYLPASDAYYDHVAPDWEPILLSSPEHYAGMKKRPVGRALQ